MSRSTRKAIYKDKGFAKESYWRIHRRVNKANFKYAITSQFTVKFTYQSDWDDSYKDIDEDDEIGWIIYSWNNKECYDFYMSNLKVDDIKDLEIEFKNPKELVNDYDYCDYVIDEENDWATFTFNLDVEHREDRKDIIAKMRRK